MSGSAKPAAARSWLTWSTIVSVEAYAAPGWGRRTLEMSSWPNEVSQPGNVARSKRGVREESCACHQVSIAAMSRAIGSTRSENRSGESAGYA